MKLPKQIGRKKNLFKQEQKTFSNKNKASSYSRIPLRYLSKIIAFALFFLSYGRTNPTHKIKTYSTNIFLFRRDNMKTK